MNKPQGNWLMRSRLRCVRGVMLGVVLVLPAGCAFKGVDGGAGGGDGAGANVWQPRPSVVHIHPSTRFVRQGGETFLEAHLEFRDALDDPLKAAGAMRLELFATDEMGRSLGRQLYVWQVPLLTLADQRLYFDSVMQSYLIRLRMDSPEAARQPTVLRVTFTPHDASSRLESQMTMPRL